MFFIFGGQKKPKITIDYSNVMGVRWHKNNPSTALERLYNSVGKKFTPYKDNRGNAPWTPFASDFLDLDIYKDIKKVSVSSSGKITASSGLDDPDLNTMVQIPKYYYKIIDTEEYRDYLISKNKLDKTWLCSPRHQGYDGHPEERDFIYVGLYLTSENGSVGKTKYTSGGIDPIVSQTLGEARKKNCAIGANFYQYDYATFWTIALLYLVEVANLNSQAAVGSGRNSASSASKIGESNKWVSVPQRSGGTSGSSVSCRYQYIENLWGNLLVWVDGIKFYNNDIYIAIDPKDYSKDPLVEGNGFIKLNYNKSSNSDFISKLGYDERVPWAQFPSDTSGGSGNTFIPDYLTTNGTINDINLLTSGGRYNAGQKVGIFCSNTQQSSSTRNSEIGSRCIYLP